MPLRASTLLKGPFLLFKYRYVTKSDGTLSNTTPGLDCKAVIWSTGSLETMSRSPFCSCKRCAEASGTILKTTLSRLGLVPAK